MRPGSRAGIALLGAIVALALVVLASLALAGLAAEQARQSVRHRAGQMARLMATVLADSMASTAPPGPCIAAGDTLVRVPQLLPGLVAQLRWERRPAVVPVGGCRWEITARLTTADGLPIAAHRAVRRTAIP